MIGRNENKNQPVLLLKFNIFQSIVNFSYSVSCARSVDYIILKMSGINVNIVLVIFLLKFSSAFISDEVKEFHFVKVNDGSDEYDFE